MLWFLSAKATDEKGLNVCLSADKRVNLLISKTLSYEIALIGYGKMGKMIESIAKSRGHEIVSIIDVDNRADFDTDAFRSADVAIEFTTPTAAYDNYRQAWAQGVKVVSGSTGWLAQHEADVRKACTAEGHTLFWASNFSLGVAIFSAVNKYLAKIMNAYPDYDVSMVETHHVHNSTRRRERPSRWQNRSWSAWTEKQRG